MESYKTILSLLLRNPTAFDAGGDEIRIECPRCKHHNSKLYIGINKSLLPKKILMYDCKHCMYQGAVNSKFLAQFDIDIEYGTEFNINETITEINSYTKMKKMKLKIPDRILDTDKFKIDYLNNRFQRELTIKDIIQYKFILNFKDFCKFNDLNPLDFVEESKKKYHKFLFNELSNHFVGILSIDNNKISFRNINSEYFKDKRYYIYTINKQITNPYLYMIDIPFDILSKNPIINIAEGAYDIIGAKELFFKEIPNNNMIFIAIGTRSAYNRALQQIIKITGWLDTNINVFCDNDGDKFGPNYYKTEVFGKNRELYNKINLFYNIAQYEEDGIVKLSKDFGNLNNPIELKIQEI